MVRSEAEVLAEGWERGVVLSLLLVEALLEDSQGCRVLWESERGVPVEVVWVGDPEDVVLGAGGERPGSC